MNIDRVTGVFIFNKTLTLKPFMKKKEIMASDDVIWEAWPDKGNGTVSYRTIFNIEGNRQGDIYLIVDFIQCNDMNATIGGWSFAPYKLIDGKQKKQEGKVTKGLREWFKQKVHIELPIYGTWGHIDAAYDPWNCAGAIYCNYRSGFKDEQSWKDYCKWNNIKI